MDSNIGYGVYRIVAPSGSTYIGMTAKSFSERRDGHKANFRKGQMTCIGLQRAFEKYGVDQMSFEILEDMTGYGDSEILYRERLWWLRHRAWGVNLYNGEPTGRGAVRHTEETRMKIRLSSLKNDGKLRDSSGHRLHELICLQCKDSYLSPKIASKFCSQKCAVRSKQADAIAGIDIMELKLLRSKGMSLRDLSRKYGPSHEGIRRILERSS